MRGTLRRLPASLLLAAALIALAPAGAEAGVKFELKGQWTCKDGNTVKPLSGARIELFRERSYWRDEKITKRYTDGNGRYSINVSASGNFDLYVKVLLHDDDGVELENWYSPFTWETSTSTKRSRAGTVDLGTWQISKDGSGSPKCAVWQGVHNAYGNYRQVVGSRPPTSIKVEGEFPCCGTPFTTTNTIRWPGGYGVRANYSVPFHEFAHSMRHSFDGNFLHFGVDAAKYSYPQTHTSCKVTNQGFAFNEGWAEYWAGDYSTCSPATNYNQEGNVAAELARLERCSNRPAMVRVLRESKGQIHSIGEFQTRFAQLIGPCSVPLVATSVGDEPPLTVLQQLADVRAQIVAQKKLIAGLDKQEAAARRSARDPGRCSAGRCTAAMEKLIAPSALEAQGAQARLVLKRLEQGLAAARKAQFDPGRQITLSDDLLGDRDSFEKASQKILIAGLEKGLREIRTEPGFNRGERSDLFKTMDRRSDSLARARKRGQDTPAGLDSLFAAPGSPLEQADQVKRP